MSLATLAFDKQTARSRDADGRMRVRDCILSTAEINPYRGEEIPGHEKLGLKPYEIYDIYRDPEELKKSVKSFEGLPLMIKHVAQTADAPNKEYQGGSVYAINFDGKYLRGDLLVSDGYAIDLIESGELTDLSCSYRYVPDMTPGEINGKPFHGIMRVIDGNHVALVPEGRASKAHVADAAFQKPQGASQMAFPDKESMTDPSSAPAVNPATAATAPTDMATLGQALKHIATLLEAMNTKLEGTAETMDTAAVDAEMNIKPAVGSEQEIKVAADESDDDEEKMGAKDSSEEKDNYPMPKQAEQDGTSARGSTTLSMDARSVRTAIDTAVQAAVKTERLRATQVEQAKRDTRGVLGDVYGLDSASKIYREALAQVGVDMSVIKQGHERSAWETYKVAAGAIAGQRPKHEYAIDAKEAEEAQRGILRHLSKIRIQN